MKEIKPSSKELQNIYERHSYRKRRIEERVRRIIEDVKLNGDEAIVRYTKKFDRVVLSPKHLKVTESEISGAYQNINPQVVETLKVVIENVNKFYKHHIKKSWTIKDTDGVTLGEKYQPLDKVGIYVPAGTAPLVSTVYMTVLPAKIAGVEKIVLLTPPNEYKSINPYILAVANLLKVDEIYKVGGAQAIAALAFGTKTIPRVDKIVGPGNFYVNEAKRQVFGYVDVDMIAGPSEVVIIANQYSNPLFVVHDLKAQAEHFGGLAVLITTSKKLARLIKKDVEKGYVIVARNLDHMIEITNHIAPEHLQIMVKNPQKIIKKVRNVGAIFVGPYTPVAVGDYIAGPSHVLPTNGTTRFFSGLRVSDFIKSTHVISYTKRALEKARPSIEQLTTIENLREHLESVIVRFPPHGASQHDGTDYHASQHKVSQ